MMETDSDGAADAVMVHGRALLAADQPLEAKAVFQRVLAADPRHVRAWVSLGDAAAVLGASSEALDAYRRAERRRPRNMNIKLRIARMLMALSQYDEAGRYFEAVVSATPTHYRATVGCAQAARRRGDHARALTAYRAALAMRPDDARLALRVAESLQGLSRMVEAAAAYTAVLVDQPDSLAAMIGLGDIARVQGRLPDALTAYRHALAKEPGHRKAGLRAAGVLVTLGEIAEARAALDAVLAAHPDDPAALLMLGNMMLQANNRDEGRDVLARAAVAAPRNARAWARLARSEAAAGDALAIIDKAETTLGENAVLAIARINRLFRRGLIAEAEGQLAAALRHFPGDRGLMRRAVEADIVAGRFKAAKAGLARLPTETRRQRIEHLMLVGKLAESQRRVGDAANAYESVIQLAPSHPRAYIAVARMELLRLRADAAHANLEAACRHNRGTLLLRGKSLNASQSLVGEFVNDYRSNPAALAAGRAALEQGDLGAMLRAVLAEPNHTGTAIGLLMLLRHRGLLNGMPAAVGERRIPRRIVQFWNDAEPPADVADLMASWQANNPGWEYTRYSDETARQWLSASGDLLVYRAWRSCRRIAQRADLFRLAVLAREGGVYADADDRCVAGIEAATAKGGLLVWQEYLGSSGNNFIAAAPGHPIIRRALTQATAAILRGDAESIWFSTGPGLLSRCIAHHLASEGDAVPSLSDDIRVLERAALRAVCIPGCEAAYKTGNRHWLRSEFARSADQAAAKQS